MVLRLKRINFNWKFVLVYIWFYGYSFIKRGPIYVLSYLALPLSLLFFIYLITKGSLIYFAILGGMISIVTNNALTAVGDISFFKLELKIQELLVSAGVYPIEYLFGISLGNLLFSLPGLLLFIFLGFFYKIFGISLFLWTLLNLFLVMISSTSIAYLVASRLNHVRSSWGIGALLSVILTMLPPLYYPYKLLPTAALYSLLFSPATPASVFLQGILINGKANFFYLIIVIIETIAYPIIALKLGRWES